MTLLDEIKEFQEQFVEQVPEETREEMQQETQKLIDQHLEEKALKVGDKIPEFTLEDTQGNSVNSKELGLAVISFNRGNWCPYCNLEMAAFVKEYPRIKELGAELDAIAPVVKEKYAEMGEQHEAEFPLLSDEGNKVGKQFGIVFKLSENLQRIYEKLSIDVQAHNQDGKNELPIPATYVVDNEGIIQWAFINADYTKRSEPDEVIQALKELE